MSELFFLPAGMRLLRVEHDEIETPLRLAVRAVSRSSKCPLCQRPSRRVHSHYWRTLQDLPCSGRPVRLRVQARRFFCGNRHCVRRIFVERLTPLTRAHAHRTDRIKQAQTALAHAVGSRPGVRLATNLSMPASASTLLRLERADPPPARPTPRVLGVDDWAFRKGHHYGTILFDLERHWVVDLLADRKPETLAAWLKEHPGVEIVSRDRAEAYASGIRQGAPEAQQVTDRWHLVKNLGQALERVLEGKHSLLHQAAQMPVDAENPGAQAISATTPEENGTVTGKRQQERLAHQKQCHRQERLQRYEQVRDLFAKGWTISAIATHLDLSRKTVQKFATAATFPERRERTARPCQIDAFKKHLHKRWQEGCHNAVQLCDEIRERGYRGGYTTLRDYLSALRRNPTVAEQAPTEKVSVRQVVMWTLRRDTDRTSRQQAILDRLGEVCEPLRIANLLAQRFLSLIRQCPRTDQTEPFRDWLSDTLGCGVAPMRTYASSLQQDQAAVEAGLSLTWSNGPVEGSNNRLKFLKRRGYGRAHFDLLRRRVLEPT